VSSNEWFVGRNGQRLGPYRFEALRQLAERNKLQPDDLVWTEGMPDWRRADAVKDLPVRALPDSHSEGALFVGESSTAAVVAEDSTTRAPRSNYFSRHWRGELSLPLSYWVNGALVTVLVVTAFSVLGESDYLKTSGPLGSGIWILAALMFLWSLTIWQLVGVWRSADNSASRGGSSAWASVAKVMVVLGALRLVGYCIEQEPLLREGFRLVYSGDNTIRSQLHVVNHAKEVELAGGMSFGTANALGTILEATPTIRTIQLNNIGGRIIEGSRVGELIKAHHLSTFTARECVSACLLAFLAGRERYLGSSGKLGFHQASVDGSGGEVAEYGTNQFREALLGVGTPLSFVDRALAVPPSQVWYPTSAELISAHVVTAVVDERQYAATGISGWQDREKLKTSFAEIPLFAALRGAEPKEYEKLEEEYIDGVQAGESEGELTSKVRTVVVERLLPKYMRIGPDAELVAYWQSQIAEMRELRTIDPKYCVAFLNPTSADNAKTTDLLSADARGADISALAALFEATVRAPETAPTETQVHPTLRVAALQAERHLPGSVRIVANPGQAAKDTRRLCDAYLAFYGALLALPAHQAGPVLRFIAASN
jgi:hypothetical protein